MILSVGQGANTALEDAVYIASYLRYQGGSEGGRERGRERGRKRDRCQRKEVSCPLRMRNYFIPSFS
jgi:hypothetical protein